MALEERVAAMREEALEREEEPVPTQLQGVSKDRIRAVLERIDRHTDLTVDAVFALLDDHHSSWFSKIAETHKFCAGATTAHIACHVGILQQGGRKHDREGRDYWIKPLRDVGAIEPVYLKKDTFLVGHPVAKSPNSAYRLADDFKAIFRAPDGTWECLLDDWIQEDAVRQRLEFQAELAEQTRQSVDTKHADLIQAACEHYVPRFLQGYEILYIDDSDGEVDLHKVEGMKELADRFGKSGVGFTTVYLTWRSAAARQGKLKNLAPDSYLWIMEDPSKHLHVLAFPEG